MFLKHITTGLVSHLCLLLWINGYTGTWFPLLSGCNLSFKIIVLSCWVIKSRDVMVINTLPQANGWWDIKLRL